MIIKAYKARQVHEGAGVIVNRVFGYGQERDFDPFLMLDYFDQKDTSGSPGFPWHPHKGIETISYLLRGAIEHQDSIGNKGIIGPGELQWMTAGRGIQHQEMPKESPQGLEGFQFWLNLPQRDKLIDPTYQYMLEDSLQVYEAKDYRVKVISGTYQGLQGPINKDELGVRMLHISSDAPVEIDLTRSEGKKGFIFVFTGKGSLNDEAIEAGWAYTLEAGSYVLKGKIDLIFAEGKPLNEPIAWRGPIVMNTEEELRETFKDLEMGRF